MIHLSFHEFGLVTYVVYYYFVVCYLLICVVDFYSMIERNQQRLGHYLNAYVDLIDE